MIDSKGLAGCEGASGAFEAKGTFSAPPSQADRTLEALLERVKGARGPDRDIDHAVLATLGLMKASLPDPIVGREMINVLGGRIYSHPAPITESLDAVVALCDRVLPGADWMVDQRFGRPAAGFVFPRGLPYRRCVAATPALALLTALLEALVKSRSPSLVG